MSHLKLKTGLSSAIAASFLLLTLLPSASYANHVKIDNNAAPIADKLSFQHEIQKIMGVISEVNLSYVDKAAVETFQDIQQFKARFYMGEKQADKAKAVNSTAPEQTNRNAF